MTTPLRIVVIKDSPSEGEVEDAELADALRDGLIDAGYDVVATLNGDLHLPQRLSQLAPDMIIIHADSDARDVLEHVVMATRDEPRPIVMFTEHSEPNDMRAAIAAGVSAYVVAGLQPQRVKPVLDVAMARFTVEQKLRAELSSARSELAERKVIERAKGLLMTRNGYSEEEAFRQLRRQAMDKNLKIVEIAQRILDVADLLG